MIRCAINRTDDVVNFVNVSGHSNFSTEGSDIVCAAVSMLCYGIGNALIKNCPDFDLKILDNEFIFYDNVKTHDSKLLIDVLIDGLKMVEDQYSKYIQIEEV